MKLRMITEKKTTRKERKTFTTTPKASNQKKKKGVDENTLRLELAEGYMEMAALNKELSNEDIHNTEKDVGGYENFLLNCENYFEFDN